MNSLVENVVEQIRRAVDAVEAAEVPQDLRPAAFSVAIDLLARPSAVDPRRAVDELAPAVPSHAHGESLLEKIARRLGVDEDVLSYIYEQDGDELMLVVRRNMLPNPGTKAAAMRDIALLTMAGRQAAEIEEWTTYDLLRAECDELKVLDRVNFATEIQTLDIRVRGPRRAREAKLTRHGFDQAQELIRHISEGLARSAQASL